MAIVKFSGLVTSMVGKVSGGVMQGGRYGTVLRSNSYGRRPQSAAAYGQRSVFAAVSNFNAHLNQVQRDSMASAGALITRPTKGGPATPYSWWSFSMAFNGKLYVIGESFITAGFVAPSITALGVITATHIGGTTTFDLQPTTDPTTDFKLITTVGPPMKSIAAFKASRQRVVGVDIGGGGTYSINQSAVAAIFGSTAFDVARWFTMQVVDRSTGYFGPVSPVLYLP